MLSKLLFTLTTLITLSLAGCGDDAWTDDPDAMTDDRAAICDPSDPFPVVFEETASPYQMVSCGPGATLEDIDVATPCPELTLEFQSGAKWRDIGPFNIGDRVVAYFEPHVSATCHDGADSVAWNVRPILVNPPIRDAGPSL